MVVLGRIGRALYTLNLPGVLGVSELRAAAQRRRQQRRRDNYTQRRASRRNSEFMPQCHSRWTGYGHCIHLHDTTGRSYSRRSSRVGRHRAAELAKAGELLQRSHRNKTMRSSTLRILVVVTLSFAASCGSASGSVEGISAASTAAETAVPNEDPVTIDIDVLFDDETAVRVAADGVSILLRMTDGEIDPSATFPDELPIAMLSLARWPQADGRFEYTAQQFSLAANGERASCGLAQGLLVFDSPKPARWNRGVKPPRGGFEDPMVECEPPDQLSGFEYLLEGPLSLTVTARQELALAASGRTATFELTTDPRL